jgi:transposase
MTNPALKGVLPKSYKKVFTIEDEVASGKDMMGQQDQQKALFSYHIDLDRRVRADHPLRRVAATIDFTFARQRVAHTYGDNGNVSVDPAVILKMMFLLFYDNVASERQLMKIIAERLDYLWFLGYGLDQEIPDHSVLSKARTRWGNEVFERLFVQTITACVKAGLVEGSKVHLDGSLIAANASCDSVVKGSPELIAALKGVYQEQVAKLDEPLSAAGAVNQTHVSTTDPQAPLAAKKGQSSRPSYKEHRGVDNAHGVITAQTITGGAVSEDTQLMALVQQHQWHTQCALKTVVADSQYGTVKNFLACQDRGLIAHMADLNAAQREGGQRNDFFGQDQFRYDSQSDTYRCPAGEVLQRWQHRPDKGGWQYKAPAQVCARCPLRPQCTDAKHGRRVQRLDRQDELDALRAQSASAAARADRKRRRSLMEGSFADATNSHGFKRARWRGLWRQRIQGHLIAACQNIRLWLRKGRPAGKMASAALFALASRLRPRPSCRPEGSSSQPSTRHPRRFETFGQHALKGWAIFKCPGGTWPQGRCQ